MLRGFISLASVLLLSFVAAIQAEESETPEPKPTAKPHSSRVTFLPPPLEGSISLGIYDSKGKLVRVLHREADLDEFNVGADALSTTWDGKNDNGEDVPPGRYRAHGFVVDELQVEGVGFFFNDWITTEDSPRISRIRHIGTRDDKLLLSVELVGNRSGQLLYDIQSRTMSETDAIEPEATPSPGSTESELPGTDPIMSVPGRDGTRWVIDRTEKSATTTELKQFSGAGEFLRRFNSPPDQPQPVEVAASITEDRIYLLEENSAMQRLRALRLVGSNAQEGQPVSDWKVEFEKSIVMHPSFSIADGKPVVSSRPVNVPSIKVKLQPNPLLNDQRVTVELSVGFDSNGSFLKTTDGLPLYGISETPGVIRTVVIGHGANGIDLFQDDGAVVEQFRVTGLDNMMSFDCGNFELK